MSNNNKKVIVFNGPPRSGKDTGVIATFNYVNLHAPWITVSHDKLSAVPKKAVHTLFEVIHTPEYIDKQGLKDTPYREMDGMTPREAYIWMIESLRKERGEDILGRMQVMRMAKKPNIGLHLLSDGGNACEVAPIIKHVGQKNVLIIHLTANDTTFDGDSRSYIADELLREFPNLKVQRIHNTISADPEDRDIYRLMCYGAAKKFLGLTHED